jgi:hypothetical protein
MSHDTGVLSVILGTILFIALAFPMMKITRKYHLTGEALLEEKIKEKESGSSKKVTRLDRRRVSDRSPASHLGHVMVEGDVSMMVLLSGLGLILWSIFGWFSLAKGTDLVPKVFFIGIDTLWLLDYLGCGVAMWLLVAYKFPPVSSLLIGSWVCVTWLWLILEKMTSLEKIQLINPVSVIYVLVGLLIIHRSARR